MTKLPAILFASLSLLQATCAMAATPLEQRLDAALAPMFKPNWPGATVIVTRDGKPVFRKAYGLANVAENTPMQPDMQFRMGSITTQFTGPGLGRRTQHRRLLEDLASAAEHHQAGRALRPVEQGLGLRPDGIAKAGIALRIVEIGQHHLLPDHDAELIAEREERVVLICHDAGHTDHVHVRIARDAQPWLVGGPASAKRDHVGAAPARATAENGDAVDDEAETLAIGTTIDGYRPESDAAEVDGLVTQHECRRLAPSGADDRKAG